MKREIRMTKDGSPTLFVEHWDEHYHSHHGAVQESEHVFIAEGFQAIPEREINILEIGLGTGLNALLTERTARESGKTVHYHALERYPVKPQEAEELNYPAQVKNSDAVFFNALHKMDWGQIHHPLPHFSLYKEQIDFTDFSPSPKSFHLIYFDAFAPDAQPELWTVDMFSKMYEALRPGGILVTYSSKGQVRRNMLACGFEVEKRPGPPGKREILRAKKPTQ